MTNFSNLVPFFCSRKLNFLINLSINSRFLDCIILLIHSAVQNSKIKRKIHKMHDYILGWWDTKPKLYTAGDFCPHTFGTSVKRLCVTGWLKKLKLATGLYVLPTSFIGNDLFSFIFSIKFSQCSNVD